MADQSLARQAERHLECHGDGDPLFFEGQWFSRAGLAGRASRGAEKNRRRRVIQPQRGAS